MKKLKKNWLVIIIGMHIVCRLLLYGFVTNDEIDISTYKLTTEVENINDQTKNQEVVLLD